MKSADQLVTGGTGRELVMTRTFDAPRDLVFKVWTDPKHLVHWYGPDGFTITVQQFDLRPEGVWKMIMHGPDGTDYPNYSVFKEVVAPERLVYEHGSGKPNDPEQFLVTVTFEAEGDRTKLTMEMLFMTKEVRDMVVEKYGAIEGNKQTMNKLEQYLRTMPAK
jgi:uncharacterized protein YndB with AHSA1/START domain